MNSLIKGVAFTTMFSLAMASTANATQLDSSADNIKRLESQSLIAQKYPSEILNQTRSSQSLLNEMILLDMKMVELAEKGLQSQEPEIKSMAQEIIKSRNTEINKMMEMRRKRYEDG